MMRLKSTIVGFCRAGFVVAALVLWLPRAVLADTFTIPESTLLGSEFSYTQWGGPVIRTDVPGAAVLFDFYELDSSTAGVEDDYPVQDVYGQILPSHANGDFSNFDGYTLWVQNLDDQPVMVCLYLNTGFTGPSGIPPYDARNDTFWQSPWVELSAGQAVVLYLDFNNAIPYHVEDNQLPHTQGGLDGVPMAINAYDRTEVDTIGFEIATLSNPEAAILVAPYAPETEPPILTVLSTPISGIPIAGTPQGITDYSAERDKNTTVILTAPERVSGVSYDYRFCRWTVNGTAQAEFQRTLAFNINSDATVVAEYTRNFDFDGNGTVDFWDLIAFIDVYGLTDEDDNWLPKGPIGDCNDSYSVDFTDFMEFIDAYGT